MSTLFDVTKNQVMDFVSIEKLTWAKQEGKIADFELLSVPTYGLYVWRLLNNPKLQIVQNFETTGKKLPHMLIALREQEEFSGQLYGNVTGRVIEKSGKQTVKLESVFDVVDTFESLLGQGKANDSDINTWQVAWRLAYAVSIGFISEKRYRAYAKTRNVSPEIANHALSNWRSESPAMLNKSYQNGKTQPVATNGKAVKVTA